MTIDRRKLREMLSCCEEVREDDGIDPREFFKNKHRPKKEEHRTERLCQQVAETLQLVLFDALRGPPSSDTAGCLQVESVAAAPNAGRLRVSLRWTGVADELDRKAVEEGLARAAGRLRCEVAAAITRRKAPHLVFEVLGPESPARDAEVGP